MVKETREQTTSKTEIARALVALVGVCNHDIDKILRHKHKEKFIYDTEAIQKQYL